MITRWLQKLFPKRDFTVETYKQIIQNSSSGIVLVDAQKADMPIIYVNEAFEKITGYSLEDAIGRNCRFLQNGDDDQPDIALIRNAIQQGGSCTATLRNYRKDGTLFWNELRISPIHNADGVITHFVGMQNDVTELWQIRHELEMTKTRLEFSLETARIAWWELDIQTNKLQFDARKFLMAGYNPNDFTDASHQELLKLVHPDDVEDVMCATSDLLERKNALYMIDYRLKCADGHWMWFHDRGELAFTKSGRQIVRGFSIDITDRKQAQQKDLQLLLERERVNLLVTFIQNATHEFRTPLSIINSCAYLLSRVDDVEKRQTKLTQIQAQVTNISRLVETLLTIVELEYASVQEKEKVNLTMLWEDICKEAILTYGDMPHLIYTVERDLPQIKGSFEYLREAFYQIINNAYHFTPSNGVIRVKIWQAEGKIYATIEDSGEGIPPEAMPHIFEMFWRLDTAHTTPGLGLGLSIAKKAVELHQGTISVESQLGQGTKFTITLPIVTSLQK